MARSRMLSARGAVCRALMVTCVLVPLAMVIAVRGVRAQSGGGGEGVSDGTASASAPVGAGSDGGTAPLGDVIGSGVDGMGVGGVAVLPRVVLEPAFNPFGPMRGRVRVFDRVSGELLWERLSPRPNDLFGLTGVVVPDIDGDGVKDVVISAPASVDSASGVVRGLVYVMSGVDGAVVRTFVGDPGETFGVPLGLTARGGEPVLVVGLVWAGEPAGGSGRDHAGTFVLRQADTNTTVFVQARTSAVLNTRTEREWLTKVQAYIR